MTHEDSLVHYWDPLNDHKPLLKALTHCGVRTNSTYSVNVAGESVGLPATCEACILLKFAAFAEGKDFVVGMFNYNEHRDNRAITPKLAVLHPPDND